LLLDFAKQCDPELHCWLQVAVATGARRGEVCALRWSDIDLGGPTVRIERSVGAARGSGVYVKTTKTGGVRRVSITTLARDALAARLEDAGSASGATPVAPTDFVFAAACSSALPMRPESLTRRWQRLRQDADAQSVRLHDIRHFVATELLTAGFDVRTVSNRLGHARTSTTMDIYWAFVPARDREAAEHLDAILTEARTSISNSCSDAEGAYRRVP
jgi:integrase